MKREEQELQKAVCAFLDVALPRGVALYFHVPNGGLRSKVEAGIMKALGIKAGVADLCIIWSPPGARRAHVGFIELKAVGGKLSPEQLAFGASCKALNARCDLAHSLDEVEEILRRWGVPLRSHPLHERTVLEAA